MKKTVNVTYKFSKPVDPGQSNSPWTSAEVSYAIETNEDENFDLSEVDSTEILAVTNELMDAAQLQAFTRTGTELKEIDINGKTTLVPVWEVIDVPTVRPKASPAKAISTAGLNVVTIGGVEYHDYRAAKEDETVNPNFPDFKTLDGKTSKWIKTKDGQDTAFGKAVAAEGIV